MYRRAQPERERGPVTVASTDGAGPLPAAGKREIFRTLDAGGHVRVATDNDAGGERLWQQMRALVREGPDRQSARSALGERVHTVMEEVTLSERTLVKTHHLGPERLRRDRPALKDWNEVLQDPVKAAQAQQEQGRLATRRAQDRADAGGYRHGDRATRVRQTAAAVERWREEIAQHPDVLGDRAERMRETATADRAERMKREQAQDRGDRR